MKHIGPSGGYDFGAKRHYRRIIWRRFREHCGVKRAESHAMLMPAPGFKEIEVALQNGFREEHLHVANWTSAIVAHAKRKYPKIHTYGVAIEEACRRMAIDGHKLRVANFDLCSNVSQARTLIRLGVALRWLCDEESVCAVTVLRGRETNLGDLIESVRPFADRALLLPYDNVSMADKARIAQISGALTLGMVMATTFSRAPSTLVTFPRDSRDVGIYRSSAGNQTMLWVLFRFVRFPYEAIGALVPRLTPTVQSIVEDILEDKFHVFGRPSAA